MFTLTTAGIPGVFVITLDRPPANAMGFDEVGELHAVLTQASSLSDANPTGA